MKQFLITLHTVHEIQAFVATITPFQSDFDLCSGRYIIDAKSIMGIFSLDLKNPLELKVYKCDDEIERALQPFVTV